jgi:hypothetical protein
LGASLLSSPFNAPTSVTGPFLSTGGDERYASSCYYLPLRWKILRIATTISIRKNLHYQFVQVITRLVAPGFSSSVVSFLSYSDFASQKVYARRQKIGLF